MNIVPTDEIKVEITKPQRKWKLPLAETLAISAALLIYNRLNSKLSDVKGREVYRFWL